MKNILIKGLCGIMLPVLFACHDSDEAHYVKPIEWIDQVTPVGVTPTNENIGSGWNLVFSDEFEDNRIDFDKWTLRNDKSVARPYHGVTEQGSSPENVCEQDGNLVLQVNKIGTDKVSYGDVYSYKKFNLKYGYIEARMKIADMNKAVMTAFWMQTTAVNNVDSSGNDGAEIDIFESAFVGDKAISTVHFDGYGEDHQQNPKEYEVQGLADDYHIWGLFWDEKTLKIYCDGVLKTEFDGIWVPQVEEYIELSTGITFKNEGDFKNQPADSLLSEAYVDYVRVWTNNETKK